jgi:hypothetical protein
MCGTLRSNRLGAAKFQPLSDAQMLSHSLSHNLESVTLFQKKKYRIN